MKHKVWILLMLGWLLLAAACGGAGDADTAVEDTAEEAADVVEEAVDVVESAGIANLIAACSQPDLFL